MILRWDFRNSTCWFLMFLMWAGSRNEKERKKPGPCAGRFGEKKCSKQGPTDELDFFPSGMRVGIFSKHRGLALKFSPKIAAKSKALKSPGIGLHHLLNWSLRREWTINLFWRTRKMLSTCKVAVTSMFFEVFDKTGDVSWFFTFLGEQTMPNLWESQGLFVVRSDLVCGVGLKERSMAPWWIPALVPKSLVIHVNPDGNATFFW